MEMKKNQKILLALSVVAYAVVLISFLTQNMWVLLVSFVISSALLICFAMSGKTEDEEIEQSFKLLQAQKEIDELAEERRKIQDRLMESERNLEQTRQQLSGALSESEEKLKSSREEAEKMASDAALKAREEAIRELEEKSCERAELFEGILPPTSKEEGDKELIDVIALCRETVAEFDSFAEKAEVSIKLSCAVDSIKMRADTQRMRIMFRNIIDNSIKYMNRAGSLVITISTLGDDIFIVLKDNGNGLSSQETEHIFELNFQGSNRISGNGLGLTQAKAIVDYYGGTIYAKSNEGTGMGIYIQLPSKNEVND